MGAGSHAGLEDVDSLCGGKPHHCICREKKQKNTISEDLSIKAARIVFFILPINQLMCNVKDIRCGEPTVNHLQLASAKSFSFLFWLYSP